MRWRAAPLRTLLLVLAMPSLLALGGCSSLPFFGAKDEADKPKPAPQVELYALDVEAPAPLRKLLLDYLDLARFQKVPQDDAITDAEIDRLAAAAPAQARALLETEGYFDAEVRVARTGGVEAASAPAARASAPAGPPPRLTITVVPGPRVNVATVSIDSTAPLAQRSRSREEPWRDRLQHLRDIWPMQPGHAFRQPDWSSAKTAALGALRADGYPRAEWSATAARIDATAETAALSVTVDSGPLFRLGAIRIEGVNRYDVEAVRRLATFFAGEEYSEKKLFDYQERIVKAGLFEGASVELDTSGEPEAAPIVVKVKELNQHQATFGVGYSANTGPRVSVEHYDRKVFGLPWIAHSTLTVGPDLKSLGTEFTSYPRERLWRNLAAANVEQLDAADERRESWTVRAGRSKDTTEFERLIYVEASKARVDNAELATSAEALSANYNWLRRHLDNILLPTKGTALALQGGIGYGSGKQTRADEPGIERATAPFVRTYARVNAYEPLGSWFGNARLELGQVFVNNRIAVPDTLLFRAGGDNSVRGYGYRTLGPEVNGAVVGGRVLATASVEFEHPILDRLPALLGAVFVDAGNAADRWARINPVVGVGVGVHYRSPVGPLRLDVAYGESTKNVRLHLSVGVQF